jgi:pimeloyl-ACP methyl ester carboxylesterase
MSEVRSVSWPHHNHTYHALVAGPQPPRHLMLHANGFNGGTYQSLLQALAPELGWAAPDFRGHGQSFVPDRIRNWSEFVADVVAWKGDGRFEKPIAIGHSLGGVTAVMTEAKYPGTFRAIALVDPVIFAPRVVAVMAVAKLPLLRGRHPLARGARSRRMEFPSREAVIESYRAKRTFKNWRPEFLENYIRYGTHAVEGGVRLSCPGEIEAQIFSTWPVMFWRWISRVKVPVLILRGATSEVFWDETAKLMVKKLPVAEYHTIDGAGHFLPMEQPEAVLTHLRAWEAKHGLR